MLNVLIILLVFIFRLLLLFISKLLFIAHKQRHLFDNNDILRLDFLYLTVLFLSQSNQHFRFFRNIFILTKKYRNQERIVSMLRTITELVKNSNNSYVPANDGNVRIINYITKVNIEKTGYGNPLEGVQFELYNEDKSEKLKCTVDAPGLYTYVDDQASVDNYVYVTNSSGKITINNLPEGTYYFKEIYTPTPYVLPQGDGVYTKVVIGLDEKGVSIDGNYLLDTIFISNSLNSFNFYKRDTEGNALTTGKYKLQKYDKKAKKYVDLKLVEVENDGTYNPNADIYKVDEKNGKIQFTLTKGVATFIEMEPSTTYRIIETVAPAGYTKASTKDTATAYIDEYGNASGLLVLIDQKIVKEDDSAFAELIINIQTGKQRIMYAGVILVVVTIIVGLIVYNKKK